MPRLVSKEASIVRGPRRGIVGGMQLDLRFSAVRGADVDGQPGVDRQLA